MASRIHLGSMATGALIAWCMAMPSSAKVTLLARGSVAATSDLSGLNTTLENGLAANIFGGIGSGLAYLGGGKFLAVPDRGSNATPYNSKVDNTVSYISRFHTIAMTLAKARAGPLPFTLASTLEATTLLWSSAPLVYGDGAGLGTSKDGSPLGAGAPSANRPGRFFFSGRSDNFGAGNSASIADARLDPESIRVSRDGRSIFISDEYGPYVRAFDRRTGMLEQTFVLPADFAVDRVFPTGKAETSANSSGRVDNKGMEGLALTPDGKTLVGIMQAALIQDAADAATRKMLRIVTINIATGATRQFGYLLSTGSGVSDITAINDHAFLVDERDGAGLGDGSKAKNKSLFRIDLTEATDISAMHGASAAAVAVGKALFVDLVKLFEAAGIASDQIPAKIEGITFGPDVAYDGRRHHTLYISNDNDFLPETAGPNQIFVIGFDDADLPGLNS